jgi:hypothetical protein
MTCLPRSVWEAKAREHKAKMLTLMGGSTRHDHSNPVRKREGGREGGREGREGGKGVRIKGKDADVDGREYQTRPWEPGKEGGRGGREERR